jgi:hypothetical protein
MVQAGLVPAVDSTKKKFEKVNEKSGRVGREEM